MEAHAEGFKTYQTMAKDIITTTDYGLKDTPVSEFSLRMRKILVLEWLLNYPGVDTLIGKEHEEFVRNSLRVDPRTPDNEAAVEKILTFDSRITTPN